MNITATSSKSFLIEYKTAKLSINLSGEDVSLFTTFQEKESKNSNTLHWSGEYETKGISVFISPVLQTSSIAKIFAEGVRIVVFHDENLKEFPEEKFLSYFENTDILLCIKGENGLENANYKKLIEKIDPRMIICAEGETQEILHSFSFPLQNIVKLNITQEKLPIDTTEYYTLSF